MSYKTPRSIRSRGGETDIDARRAKRLKIFEPSTIADRNGEKRAHLLDISETGALVHCADTFTAGAAVTLRIRGQLFAAQVVWAKESRLGITFAAPVSADMIQSVTGG